MATIKPPKSAGPPEVKKLKIGSKSLKLSVYETTDTYTIFIGGHDLYCIEAMLYKPKSVFVKEFNHPVNIGLLTQIYYNSQCSLENNFQRGIDTNNIILALCSYIRKHYNYIDGLTFTDASYRTCDNGIDVMLAEMSYLRSGKTWYEKNYGAYLHSDSLISFEKMQDKLVKAKKTLSWNAFKQFLTDDSAILEEDIKKLYENASTWQDFFGKLSDIIGISEFCIYVAPWLHKFFHSVTNTSFASFKYVLPVLYVPEINYTEANYVRGGRKFTRKQKQRPRNYQ
jgi:hypothetical protein